MSRTKITVLVLLLSVVSVLMITCKHEIPGIINGGNPTQTNNCSTDSVYFVNEIQPLINSNCGTSRCHDAISHVDGIELTNYSKIRSYVTPFNAGNSKLYKVIIKTGSDIMPPKPMPALTTVQITKLQKWINQGALNNECSSGCDTTLFTYSGAVSGIMNTFCKGCHNPTSPGGGIDLSTYATVKAQALNGKLTGSIVHAAGFTAMPKGSNKLSDCQLIQVKKWIQAGTQNN